MGFPIAAQPLGGLLLSAAIVGLCTPARAADTTLVPTGAIWKYLDNGSNQGTAWQAPAFDDGLWASGPAQLGYGDFDEATVVSFGPNASNKYITTYFRRAFNVTNAASFTSATLSVLRDDGAVVYLNGVEIYRTNMPAGTILFNTRAPVAVGGAEESTFFNAAVNPALLVEGMNVLAVEIHQQSVTSSDISFDLRLVASTQPTPLILAGSVWKYLDNGSNQGAAWKEPGFSDAGWASGPAQLGYGDGDEATVVSYGPLSAQKFITTYFRRSFTVANPSAYRALELSVLRDDGAIVYLNGIEVSRTNVEAKPVSNATLATDVISFEEEGRFVRTVVDGTLLVPGTNVVAVEIHQQNPSSSDISFDLELRAMSDSAAVLTRGPYLQMSSPTAMAIRWRTNQPTIGRVRFGAAPGLLGSFVDEVAATTEHEIRLTGLTPETRYYYSVGEPGLKLAGDDADHFLETHPPVGSVRRSRFWVLGDSGTASFEQEDVRDAYYTYTGATPTDLWIMLGDNAYYDGTDAEYQAGLFDIYPAMLRKSALWPTMGNHDAHTADSPTQSGTYYNIFTLPTAAQSGGLASGTEAWYSFDYANVHFVVLDSEDSDRATSAPMMQWLQNDLAATGQQWVIALWHHPPYTKGSHDSDNVGDSGGRMKDMREIALPLLEYGGVDLIMTGHSHSYERSYLLDGHYGTSNTLVAGMILDAGDGRVLGDGAYVKPSAGPSPHEGTVHVVAGCSGQASGGSLNHPAMFVSLNTLGSLVLDVDGNRLDAKFLDATGVIQDCFTIFKSTPGGPGDMNCDGAVNLADVDPLVLALVDPVAYGLSFGSCNSQNGDVDASGLADGADIGPFIGLLTGPVCP